MDIKERIESLRTQLKEAKYKAIIIPSSDAHMGEYVADHWQARSYFSGFTGSAGTLVVTLEKAAVWTDSRYYIQGEQELAGSGIELQKDSEASTPSPTQWLNSLLSNGDTVCVDSLVFSHAEYKKIESELNKNSINLTADNEIISKAWTDRPEIPSEKIFIHKTEYAGLSCEDKLSIVKENIKDNKASHIIISALDEVAWVLNLRGSDVSFNPVFHAYLLISASKNVLFIDSRKIDSEVSDYLQKNKIEVQPYNKVSSYISNDSTITSMLADFNKINESVFAHIKAETTMQNSPVQMLKAIKNKVEQDGVRKAMLKDGVAMVKFLHWLDSNVKNGDVSEISAADKLLSFRAENENFIGESFNTISGYGQHGAIVHYSVNEQSNINIGTDNLYLVDSGGQYLEGTTDITRTLHFGEPSQEQINDFTLVLKGHIALSSAIFPDGTKGVQLDILARKALWNEGLNYGHGTGHGVGCFLNVHEGPQNIRVDLNPTPIMEGMITSNEPGLYRTNKHGIRIENLVLSNKHIESEFGTFLNFENLTLCPIETKLVNKQLLNSEELDWLNNYHKEIYEKLSPLLSEELKGYLKQKTQAI